MSQKSVCVIGLGYIGLPTAALLASRGYSVFGVDLNAEIVQTINSGNIHIVEPELNAYVRSAVSAGKLSAFKEPQTADIYMICVPTPFHEGGAIPQPNIDFVLAATKSITHLIKDGDLIILESTSPVGTTFAIGQMLQENGVEIENLYIAYCPERVLPGKIILELVENDRIVGGLTIEATKVVSEFYRTFVRGEVLETNAPTAEMCKLAENSYRDVNIAFANELSILSARAGIDVWKLIELANRHPRVNILQPGIGVGGHCIAVDPWFIVASDPKNANLIRAGREVNNFKTDWVIDQIKSSLLNISSGKMGKLKLICLGLTFKPDIDDLRESPAVQIVTRLQSEGYEVSAVEPNIAVFDARFNLMNLDEAIKEADVIVALVKHQQFITAFKSG